MKEKKGLTKVEDSTTAIGRVLKSTPYAYEISKEPDLTTEDRKDAKMIMERYAPLMTELAMTNMFQAMSKAPNSDGLQWMKTMAPYMLEKQATTIKAVTDGHIDDDTGQALKDYIKEKGGTSGP